MAAPWQLVALLLLCLCVTSFRAAPWHGAAAAARGPASLGQGQNDGQRRAPDGRGIPGECTCSGRSWGRVGRGDPGSVRGLHARSGELGGGEAVRPRASSGGGKGGELFPVMTARTAASLRGIEKAEPPPRSPSCKACARGQGAAHALILRGGGRAQRQGETSKPAPPSAPSSKSRAPPASQLEHTTLEGELAAARPPGEGGSEQGAPSPQNASGEELSLMQDGTADSSVSAVRARARRRVAAKAAEAAIYKRPIGPKKPRGRPRINFTPDGVTVLAQKLGLQEWNNTNSAMIKRLRIRVDENRNITITRRTLWLLTQNHAVVLNGTAITVVNGTLMGTKVDQRQQNLVPAKMSRGHVPVTNHSRLRPGHYPNLPEPSGGLNTLEQQGGRAKAENSESSVGADAEREREEEEEEGLGGSQSSSEEESSYINAVPNANYDITVGRFPASRFWGMSVVRGIPPIDGPDRGEKYTVLMHSVYKTTIELRHRSPGWFRFQRPYPNGTVEFCHSTCMVETKRAPFHKIRAPKGHRRLSKALANGTVPLKHHLQRAIEKKQYENWEVWTHNYGTDGECIIFRNNWFGTQLYLIGEGFVVLGSEEMAFWYLGTEPGRHLDCASSRRVLRSEPLFPVGQCAIQSDARGPYASGDLWPRYVPSRDGPLPGMPLESLPSPVPMHVLPQSPNTNLALKGRSFDQQHEAHDGTFDACDNSTMARQVWAGQEEESPEDGIKERVEKFWSDRRAFRSSKYAGEESDAGVAANDLPVESIEISKLDNSDKKPQADGNGQDGSPGQADRKLVGQDRPSVRNGATKLKQGPARAKSDSRLQGDKRAAISIKEGLRIKSKRSHQARKGVP